MLFLGVVFQSLISYFLASAFNLLPLFFISFFAFVILNVQILSLFKAITGPNILILTFIEAAILAFVWLKLKKPFLKIKIKEFLSELKNSLKNDNTNTILENTVSENNITNSVE